MVDVGVEMFFIFLTQEAFFLVLPVVVLYYSCSYRLGQVLPLVIFSQLCYWLFFNLFTVSLKMQAAVHFLTCPLALHKWHWR